MKHKIKCIALSILITACGGGNSSYKDAHKEADSFPVTRDILIEFEYPADDIESMKITGYRVYANGAVVCESFSPYQMYINQSDCDQSALSRKSRPIIISMTAISNNGKEKESEKSKSFLVN